MGSADVHAHLSYRATGEPGAHPLRGLLVKSQQTPSGLRILIAARPRVVVSGITRAVSRWIASQDAPASAWHSTTVGVVRVRIY